MGAFDYVADGQMKMFDYIDDERLKPTVSTDWKWSFSDYPTTKNGLKVFSCFACGGGAVQWDINCVAAKC